MNWIETLAVVPSSHIATENEALQDLPLFAALGEEVEYLQLTGPEATKFLQGQVTCDLREIMDGHLRLGAHCNAKGRAQATFLAYQDAAPSPDAPSETITLLLPTGMAEPTRQQLQKFAVFSKVTLTSPVNPPAAFIVGGEDAARWCETQGLPTTPQPWKLQETPTGDKICALDAALRFWLVLTAPDRAQSLLANLPHCAPMAGINGWWQCFNALGQAHVHPSTQEVFIPQELNYDLIEGINFKKGCYKGQEIIARLHFKGTPKFRCGRFEWHSTNAPVIGDDLRNSGGQSVGQIAQTAQTGENRHEILLVAKLDSDAIQGPLATENGEPVTLTRLPLPYAL